MVARKPVQSHSAGRSWGGSVDTPSTRVPESKTAKEVLAARAAVDGTTFETRADDPAYVEALLRALRDRAKDVARIRQRVVLLRAENARKAASLGVSLPNDARKKQGNASGDFGGEGQLPADFTNTTVQNM